MGGNHAADDGGRLPVLSLPDDALSVCLVTEGTYPYYPGGVSTWCHLLIRGLPEVRFVVVSIVAAPDLVPVVDLPSNVDELITVPIWGVSEAVDLHRDLPQRRLLQPTHVPDPTSLSEEFVPVFGAFLDLLWRPESDGAACARVLRRLAVYLRTHDYDATMRSEPVWRRFRDRAEEGYRQVDWVDGQSDISLADVSWSLQLLYRWLLVLSLPLPDVGIVHAASNGLASLPGIAMGGAGGAAFLMTEHGLYLRERLLGLSRGSESRFVKIFQASFVRMVVKAGYAAADLIAPGCDYNHRWERRTGAPPERLRTIHNGPDPADYPLEQSAEVRSRPPRITVLGRIDPLKDLETLLRATALVVSEVPDLELTIYGQPSPETEWYLARCRALRDDLALQDNVWFGGFASSAAAAYRAGDFVVQSSISEGFPYSIVEAMLCERAVVATDVGGVREAVGGCGILVEPGNPLALGKGMLRLLHDGELARRMGKMGRKRALERFTVQRCNSAYLDAYHEIAAPGRASAGPSVEERIPAG